MMVHLSLDRALPASWIDEVFQAHRQRQYLCELLFSSVVELMLLVTLGLRPSLHAAVRKLGEWLVPLVGCLPERQSLTDWQLRVFYGNHLPASEKRLAPLRGFRGAALPGHTLVVYDPESALVCDIVACEDAREIGAAT